MKVLAWLSVIAGAIALVLLLVVVLGTPQLRSQALRLELPLAFSDPEGTLAFVPSMILASVALALGVPPFRRRTARTGLVFGAVSWLGIFLTMGSKGLQTLF
jgi:hypothetical protein